MSHYNEEQAFAERYARIELYIQEFQQNPKAIRKTDKHGNEVSFIPDLGSYKKTSKGFELSVVQGSRTGALVVAESNGPDVKIRGLKATYHVAKGTIAVLEFTDFISTGDTREKYTMDLREKRFVKVVRTGGANPQARLLQIRRPRARRNSLAAALAS